jgi:hypothetical protein
MKRLAHLECATLHHFVRPNASRALPHAACAASPCCTMAHAHSTLLAVVYMPCLTQNFDVQWIASIIDLPITHALTLSLSLTPLLMRSAEALIESGAAASPPSSFATSSSSAVSQAQSSVTRSSTSLPALQASTVDGAVLRSMLAQRLQRHVTLTSLSRVTLLVHI